MSSFQVLGQEPPPLVRQQMEDHAELRDTEEEQDEHYLQQFEYLKKHPLNLNKADREDL